VRDEKMLENLATHDVQDVFELFNVVDKCARAVKGRAWHSQPAPEVGKADKPDTNAAAQSSGKKKQQQQKKKVGCKDKPLTEGSTTAAATAGGGCGPHDDKCPRQSSGNDEGGPRCPVHNSKCHNAEECQEIKKLTEQFREQ
jgi:hypothetical protein